MQEMIKQRGRWCGYDPQLSPAEELCSKALDFLYVENGNS
jgi:hypothetical protein